MVRQTTVKQVVSRHGVGGSSGSYLITTDQHLEDLTRRGLMAWRFFRLKQQKYLRVDPKQPRKSLILQWFGAPCLENHSFELYF